MPRTTLPAKSKADTPAAVMSPDAAMLQTIAAAARDPKVGIEKMERLFALRERLMAAEAERAFNTAMAAVQSRMVPVVRNRPNPITKSDYADIAALYAELMPLVHEAGFGLSFFEIEPKDEHHIGIGAKVTHAAGHSERHDKPGFQVPVDAAGMRGNSNKTPTQAYGSTLQYGRRYATLMIFNVPIASQDKDGNRASNYVPEAASEPTKQANLTQAQLNASTTWITKKQLEELRASMKSAGITDDKVVTDFFEVAELNELTVAQFTQALKKCKAKVKALGPHLRSVGEDA